MAQATIEQTVDEAVKAAVLRVKQTLIPEAVKEAVEQAVTKSRDGIFPVGSYWITEGTQNPGNIFGGTWKKKGQGRCLWGADDAHLAGSEIEAGLPNITGGFSFWDGTIHTLYGSFAYEDGNQSKRGAKGSSVVNAHVGFNASRSNQIYGRSSTVQPPALVVNIWVRVA